MNQPFQDITRLPITIHYMLDSQYDCWAKDCKQSPQQLRQMSEEAIRTRHHEAKIEDGHEADGRQPDILTLQLGTIEMFYTIETHAVVIRGYGWELDREPLDDFDGGGFFCDNHWHLPN